MYRNKNIIGQKCENLRSKFSSLLTTHHSLPTGRGMSLIEVVIGISVVFIAVVSVATTYNFFLRVANRNVDLVKVNYLLEEGIEAVRSIRDTDWTTFSNIATSTDKYLEFTGGVWQATDTNTYIDNKFERKFIISNVYRDAEDDIAEVGTLDGDTKEVEVFVSWLTAGSTTTQSTSVYLTNLFE